MYFDVQVGDTHRRSESIAIHGLQRFNLSFSQPAVIPGSDHVVGTIKCVANDLLKLPNGTTPLVPRARWVLTVVKMPRSCRGFRTDNGTHPRLLLRV